MPLLLQNIYFLLRFLQVLHKLQLSSCILWIPRNLCTTYSYYNQGTDTPLYQSGTYWMEKAPSIPVPCMYVYSSFIATLLCPMTEQNSNSTILSSSGTIYSLACSPMCCLEDEYLRLLLSDRASYHLRAGGAFQSKAYLLRGRSPRYTQRFNKDWPGSF
jgi:hypothetical protein